MYKIDTHTHTLISGHAYNTINEMIAKAMKKDLDILCITDHGPAMPGSANEFYFSNLRVINKELYPIVKGDIIFSEKYLRVIFGMEANIIDYDGTTDYENIGDNIHNIKHIIASFHSICLAPGTEEENTRAYIGAINKPYVSVLGHIDDGRIPCNYEKIVKAAKEKNVLIEVNNSSNSENSFRENSTKNTLEYLQLCKENDVMIVLGSDAHWDEDICNFENVLPLLKKVNFPEELIINSSKEKFLDFVDKKYEERLKFYNI